MLLAALLLITQFTGEGIATLTGTLWLKGRFGEMVRLDGVTVGIATAGGVTAAVFSTLAGLASLAGGHLSDREGRWRVLAVSLVLAVAGFAGLASGGSLAVFACGVMLLALSAFELARGASRPPQAI